MPTRPKSGAFLIVKVPLDSHKTADSISGRPMTVDESLKVTDYFRVRPSPTHLTLCQTLLTPRKRGDGSTLTDRHPSFRYNRLRCHKVRDLEHASLDIGLGKNFALPHGIVVSTSFLQISYPITPNSELSQSFVPASTIKAYIALVIRCHLGSQRNLLCSSNFGPPNGWLASLPSLLHSL